ncbi:MAG: FprA family A-type flavoprotein [Verrucomicrobiae bacterium]|nr:FprA family A-type flavoprotein [Verrucomicrobiae bacterium]
MNRKLTDAVTWVGYIDWGIRDFHGYVTERGSTYNAYLIQDEKKVLIDTVKAPYADTLLRNIRECIDPAEIDYIVCNHAEPDHSGGLPAVLAACPRAEVVCDEKCKKALGMHYDIADWPFRIVKTGDSLSIGKRTLSFVETPMAHWPESMATYLAEDKILFSMDAFGQHFASSGRFDDEAPLDVIMQEAKTYYANILMLYGRPVGKVLDVLPDLDIDIIAPSHGVIWRTHKDAVLDAYREWITCKPKPKVLVLYDTMWKSTEKMAQAILEGAMQEGIEAKLIYIRATSGTAVATEMLDAATLAFGSPTLNMTLMPEAASVLTYLKGLKPAGKAGFAFGSYGWGKGGAEDVEEYLKSMNVDILRAPLKSQYVPTPEVLDECRAAGRMLAEKARKMAS